MAPASNKVTFRFAVVEHIMGGLMANREQSQTISQEILAFEEEHSTGVAESAVTVARRVRFWPDFFSHQWAASARLSCTAGSAGLPSVDRQRCGGGRRRSLVPGDRRRRNGGAFLRALEEHT